MVNGFVNTTFDQALLIFAFKVFESKFGDGEPKGYGDGVRNPITDMETEGNYRGAWPIDDYEFIINGEPRIVSVSKSCGVRVHSKGEGL